MKEEARPLRSFGRTRSRTIKPSQAELMQSLLPKIRFPAPETGTVDLRALAPWAEATWLEIGFGGGEHLATQAARRPQTLMIGAEPFENGVASALRHVNALGLENVRIHMGDVRPLLEALPDACLDRVFVLFPDPWPKTRHRKRRLVNPAAIDAFARVLKPQGVLRFASDWADYVEQSLLLFLGDDRFEWLARRADDWRRAPVDHLATRYEIKNLGDVQPLFLDFRRR